MRIPYLDFAPSIADPSDCAPTAAIVGRTVVGPGLVMRDYATLRGDGEWVRVGRNGYFGERATVHIADAVLGARIGDDVTVGRFALVHACTVDNGVVVGDGALVMDGSHVGPGALITAGSLVPPRKQLGGGWIYSGYPVTPVREVAATELAEAAAAIRHRTTSALVTSTDLPPLTMEAYSRAIEAGSASPRSGSRSARAYVAPNALVAGHVDIADDASVYFACALVAGDGEISIGARTNVQDNSLLVTNAARGPLILGADVTIGHNVRMGAATIGDRALIGMGSQVGDGVVVEEGGCIGARAEVAPGSIIEAGWIWVGSPALPFRTIKPEERETFAEGARVYVRYGAAYRNAR